MCFSVTSGISQAHAISYVKLCTKESFHTIEAKMQIQFQNTFRNVRIFKGLFTRACSDKTRGNGIKLTGNRLRLDIRKKFFTRKAVRH